MASTEPAVGIDLGTTYSAAAHLDASGRPVTLLNAEGDSITPSAVLFDEEGVVVGMEALKAAALEPDRVALFAKRDMGNPFYRQPINGEHIPPEIVQSLVLEKLKRDAQARIGVFKKVVVTVPAYFNEPRRKATQDAGQLAGLDVIDIINEPTAAALAFGMQAGFLAEDGTSPRQERILVYDLGGGTFDVTLMDVEGNRFTTVATDGDVYLGGVDWDQRIIDYLGEQFQQRFHGQDPRKNPAGLARLRREAEDAKRALTSRSKVNVSVEFGGEGARIPLTREHFEEMTLPLVDRTRFTASHLLKEAGSSWTDLTRILLVGGSTRMPMVSAMLKQESGLEPDASLSADESVAHGAALYAGLLLSQQKPGAEPTMSVRNVNSHALGVLGVDPETGMSRASTVIPKNTPLPTTQGQRFQTARDGQRNVMVNIIEGGDASGKNGTPIGKCVIKDLPENLPAGTPVEVYFRYRPNGRLTVHARVPQLERDAVLELERASGMTETNLQEWDQFIHHPNSPLRLEG